MSSINLTFTPMELLVGLINTNNNLSLGVNQLKFKDLTPIQNPTTEQVEVNGQQVNITRDTAVMVDVLTDDVVDDFVTFKYQRINLSVLFSACTPTLLETNVAIGSNGLPVDDAVFFAEVLRKFKVNLNAVDFELSAQTNAVRVTAKVNNLAYTGYADIDYIPVLSKQLSNNLLNGFDLRNDTPISEAIKLRTITIPTNAAQGIRRMAEVMVPHVIKGENAVKLATVTTDTISTLCDVLRSLYSRPIIWTMNPNSRFSLYGAKVISNKNGLLIVSIDEQNTTGLYGNLRIMYSE